jgi:mannose-1-phosphate guanylyltransferase/mannose-6-phosphate isomerase
MTRVRPVIMAGGSGTRLWPSSRRDFPKQLASTLGRRSTLQEAAARVGSSEFAAPIVIASEEHRHFVHRQLAEIGVVAEAIILQPEPRSTTAVAALACEWALSSGDEGPLLLMPSDLVIRDTSSFREALQLGLPKASNGGIVTFGVRPTQPNTQYGYIESQSLPRTNGIRRIVRFVEKPDAETAVRFCRSGRHHWNSGMFMCRAKTLLEEVERFVPHTREAIARSFARSVPDGLFIKPERESFAAAENISIDYAVMQKTKRGYVVPTDMGWSDVGSWSAVWSNSPRDEDNNVIAGDVFAVETKNSLIRSEDAATVATIGVEDLVVVATRDAVLVAPLWRADEVKHVVTQLAEADRRCATTPPKVARPWGSYESLDEGDRFRIKRIVVDPGEQISLQKHYHRSEHWVVVKGTAEVTLGDDVFLLQENQSTFIPPGTTHRLRNPGKLALELVEVQCGSYLEEDDIIRLEDAYGRA